MSNQVEKTRTDTWMLELTKEDLIGYINGLHLERDRLTTENAELREASQMWLNRVDRTDAELERLQRFFDACAAQREHRNAGNCRCTSPTFCEEGYKLHAEVMKAKNAVRVNNR